MWERLAFGAQRGWRILALLPAGFALLTASGFAGDAPISADLGDVGFFTAHVAELFAKAIPGAKVEIKAPLALSIDVPGRGSHSATLDNVYSFCLRNPEACEKGLVAHVANMAASFEAPGGIERSQLRAIVRSAAMVKAADQAYAQRGGATISEKLIGDLWVMCAQDLPGAVGILNTNNLGALNLSRDAALVDRIQHLMPTSDGGDDFIGIGGPSEGFGVSVVLIEEAIDGGLQIGDGAEDAALEPAFG